MKNKLNIPIIGADEELIAQIAPDKQPPPGDRRPPAYLSAAENRRQGVRYDITIPAVCFPMAPSLEVDSVTRFDGIITDISTHGLGLRVAARQVQVGDHLLLGVEAGLSQMQYASITVLGTIDDSATSMRLQTTLDGPLNLLFAEDIALPEFDTSTFQYVLPFGENVFASLAMIGAAHQLVVDNVLVCPDCHAVPTTRRGCSVCLSHDTEKSTMIHHFACAHVDFVDRFEQQDEIVCPKCRGRKMIIGADYEYLDGPIQCRECGHNDLEEILIGHCMRCSNRFPLDHAEELEIKGYRVNRLDPLALIHQN
jgi:hypothetical protein